MLVHGMRSPPGCAARLKKEKGAIALPFIVLRMEGQRLLDCLANLSCSAYFFPLATGFFELAALGAAAFFSAALGAAAFFATALGAAFFAAVLGAAAFFTAALGAAALGAAAL